jgi:D-aminoacyl-tRNA deacylase
MRVVLQRVTEAGVEIDSRTVGRIGRGYLLLVGFRGSDEEEVVRWMAGKVLGLRLFGDEVGRMNLDLAEAGGDVLVVSQFTLYGDASRGRRPSFVEAAAPAIAIPLYDRFVELLRDAAPHRVETGEFGAMMKVSLVNDGPVTLVLER